MLQLIIIIIIIIKSSKANGWGIRRERTAEENRQKKESIGLDVCLYRAELVPNESRWND
jgi:hypothetical protein